MDTSLNFQLTITDLSTEPLTFVPAFNQYLQQFGFRLFGADMHSDKLFGTCLAISRPDLNLDALKSYIDGTGVRQIMTAKTTDFYKKEYEKIYNTRTKVKDWQKITFYRSPGIYNPLEQRRIATPTFFSAVFIKR